LEDALKLIKGLMSQFGVMTEFEVKKSHVVLLTGQVGSGFEAYIRPDLGKKRKNPKNDSTRDGLTR